MARLSTEWVMSCEKCFRELRINPQLTRPHLQNPNEHITAPEDAMQIDLVPVLPPSRGYENIVTAMDVFSRYLFAYPASNQDATTIAKVIITIMFKHAHLPTTLISDKGTAFTSHVNKEVGGVLGITLNQATTKHAQTIGLLERSHASIRQSLNIETGERRSLWHEYIIIAVLNYNTSYHSSIGFEHRAECFLDSSFIVFSIWKWVFVQRKIPLQNQKLSTTSLSRRKRFSKTSEEMPYKLISNTKRIVIKSQCLKTETIWLCLHPTAESRSPGK